jgi:hypothetical protein
MKKRAALTIAAGLVVALFAGAAAISLGLAGGTTAQAGPERARDPIVHTIRETVTVHKRADGEPARTVQVVTAPAPASTTSTSVTMDDSSYEHEDGEHEDGEHEDGEHDDD